MIAAAVLTYLAELEAPAPAPVRWIEHRADGGGFVVEYQLADGRIVPYRYLAGERVRYLVTYTDGHRITVATRIDAPKL